MQLREVSTGLQLVHFDTFNIKYNQRDTTARQKMHELINSDANKVTKVFSILIGDDCDASLRTSLFE